MKHGDIILDIGCGTGNLTRYLQQKFEKTKIVAIDCDHEMIEYAKCHNNDDSIEFIVHNIEDDINGSEMEKLKGKVSLVFSNYCFHWIENREKMIYNIRQLLKNNCNIFTNIFMPNSLKIENEFRDNQFNMKYQITKWKNLFKKFDFKINCNEFSIKDIIFNQQVYENCEY